jgi:5-methylcytosine-specific restriction endonuclease McrA
MDTTHSRCAQQGLTTPAQCVDHTIPLTQGGDMWDETNHMASCLACNTWKASTLERAPRAVESGGADRFSDSLGVQTTRDRRAAFGRK